VHPVHSAGASSPDTLNVSPACATLNVVSTPEPAEPAELLTTAEVMKLFHIARSTVTLWRQEGRLRGYKPAGMKQWRWPSNQPAVEEARAALRGSA
jgi:hypothetical protein